MMRMVFAGVFVAAAALAADGEVSRKIFDRMDVPAGYETVVGAAELPTGAAIGPHTHPGVEFGYIAAGEVEMTVAGQPAYRVKSGGFYKIEAGKVHDARSIGGPATAVATWVVEKGKPLAAPAK